MPRMKGSKNKPKSVANVEEIRKASESLTVKQANWTPAPKMGDIKPPPIEEFKCGCGDVQKMHYGGPRGWCNATGCKCQEFRS